MLLAAVTQTADEGFRIHDILRAVSGALEVPVIVLLVLFLLAAAALVGWLIAESCTERRHLKLALPALMETLRTAPDREAAVEESGLLRRQKDALLELLRHPDFTDATREALAIELLEREQDWYDSIVKLSELLARLQAAGEIAPELGMEYCYMSLLSAVVGGLMGLCYAADHDRTVEDLMDNLRLMIRRTLGK